MSKRVKIADLKFDPENARVRTAKGEAMIQESLRQVGAARSIVIDENGTILAGNGTVEAAGQIGIDNVVIVEASGDEIIAVRRKGLTDEQKKKLAYYDNRTGDEAEWDMEQVARDLLGGYDFLDELFDDIKVPEPEKEGTDELPEDPAEVLREKWGVEYGDLWQIGPHRILCGDSTKKEDVDRLLDGATPGLCLTDPPYGLGDTKSDKNNYKTHDDTRDSLISLIRGFLPLAKDRCTRVVITPGNGQQSLYPAPAWTMAWFTPAGVGRGPWGFCCWQPMLCYGKDAKLANRKGAHPDAIVHTESSEKNGHPCAKPLMFWTWLLERCSVDGESVYDPFVGSGTTLVAAHNEGRTCYAMEIDPAYVAVCIERMAQLGYDPDKVEKSEG